MLKGIIHCHSTYSDGEYTLAELRERFIASGLDFVCMTEHAEAFDEAKLKAYAAECESLSDERFRFVAGLEYECRERMHVLGYGVTSLVTTTDPQEVIRHIEREGGISVIAHPMTSMFPWIETFDVLPFGIEAWNSKYDGRVAPRPATFALLRRLQERRPEMRAFYGTDLHWKKQYRGMINVVRREAATREAMLDAMRAGDYAGLKDGFELPSSGRLDEEVLARFGRENERYHRRRSLLKRAKKLTGRLGLKIPAPIKAQLRRVF
ncbi:MAG TPA: PHP domain-containing protein [Pyrinomonadaceae bacterium]